LGKVLTAWAAEANTRKSHQHSEVKLPNFPWCFQLPKSSSGVFFLIFRLNSVTKALVLAAYSEFFQV
jgi:hypothetical protein